MPREESFFDMLEKASENVNRAGKLLVEILKDPSDLDGSAKRMKSLEEDGDKIVHEVMDKLHRTFITPLDREDIHGLISALDDVLDFIEAAIDRAALYRARSMSSQAVTLAEYVERQTAEIHLIVPLLRRISRDAILPHCVEINRLENAADATLRNALEELFSAPGDVLRIVQWKEIYELLEAATDKAEDVADLVEGIVLQNA
jgi:uncharacterized protein Yka (UPF0111/DUF47 family)